MTRTIHPMIDYDSLQTPPRDGDILIEPAPEQWPAMIETARRRPADSLVLGEAEIGWLRDEVRRKTWNLSPTATIIACGHQPAFVHPGVWAKNVAVARAANLLGAIGGDLIVDNDAPAALELIVPAAGPDGLVSKTAISWGDDLAGAAYEGRPALSAGQLAENRRRIAQLMGSTFDESAMSAYLDGSAEAGAEADLVDQHLAGRARLDEPLGALLHQARISSAFGGPFVADLLLNASRFAAAYNESLQEYRAAHDVRSHDRPLPDLGRDGDRIEAALWIYQPRTKRRRLWVSPENDAVAVYADQVLAGRIGRQDLLRDSDAALASLRPWVVRPRALTLTLWARLLACDLFVHGIGGAKYDRITDPIFRVYYRCAPPPIACVSATLRIPLPRHPRAQAEGFTVRHQLRDLVFNPQRYLADAPADLLARRLAMIDESAGLRESGGARADRRRVFLELRRINTDLLKAEPDIEERLRADLADLTRQAASHALARGREYFYALHPRQKLIGLAEKVAEALATMRGSASRRPGR